MMTQSVMTQAAGMLAGASGSVTLKGKQTGNDFSLLFGNSLKSAQSGLGNTKTASLTPGLKNDNKSDNAVTDDAQTDAVQNDNTSKPITAGASDQKAAVTQSDKAKVSENGDTVAEAKEDQTVDEELIAQLEAMLQTIGQAVMDQLKLSPEEFNQLLSDQSMSLTDLLQPENLQQLVLAGSGATDVMDALTDEKLADTMKQLLQTVGDIVKDSGLSQEQIKALVEQAKASAALQTELAGGNTPVGEQTNATQETVTTAKQEGGIETAGQGKDRNTGNTAGEAINRVSETSEETGKTQAQLHSNSDSRSDKEYASDRFQTFVDNLVNASQNLQTNSNGALNQTISLKEIANQIIDRIKVSVSADKTSMELQLSPESLGKVNLSVQSKGGVLTAHFVVQNEISKEAIESQIQTLRDTLQQQGVKVEAIEVTVSANAFEQSNSQSPEDGTQAKEDNSGRRITLEDALNMAETDEDWSNPQDLTGVSGSVINYTA